MSEEKDVNKKRKLNDGTVAPIRKLWSDDSVMQEFAEWVIRNGGFLADCLSIQRDPERGVGFYYTSPIVKDDAESAEQFRLLSCPKSLVFSLSSPEPFLPHELIKSKELDLHAKLVFHFCSHLLLKSKSSHWPYIRTLPEAFNTPLYFSDEEKDWLKGTNLGSGDVDKRESLWRTEWKDGLKILEDSKVYNAKEYTWDLFLRAATTFSSRSFTSKLLDGQNSKPLGHKDDEATPVLIPLWDITNHKPLVPIIWKSEDSTLDLITPEDISQWMIGKHVENNYGAKSNEELLMGYGFCIKDNPVDTVAIRMGIPPLSPEKQDLRSKMASTKDWQDVIFLSNIVDILNQAKVLPSNSTSPSDAQETTISKIEEPPESPAQETGSEGLSLSSHWPQYLLDFLRIHLSTPPEENMIEENLGWTCTRIEILIASQLEHALRVKLGGIQPILKAPVTVNAQMADIYRQGQRRIIEEHLRFLERFLKNHQVEKRITLRDIMLQDLRFSGAIYKHLQAENLDAMLEMGSEIADAVFTLSILNNYLSSLDNDDSTPSNGWWKNWFLKVDNDNWWPYPARGLLEEDVEEFESQFEEVAELSEFRENWIVPLSHCGLFGILNASDFPLSLINWAIELYDLHRVNIREEICLVRI